MVSWITSLAMVDGVVLAKGTHCSNACRCAVRSIALLAFLANIESECRDVRTALVDDTTDEGGGPRQTLGSMVRNVYIYDMHSPQPPFFKL